MTTWIRHRTTRTSTRTIIIPCYYYYFFFIFNITLAFATHFSFISSSSHTLRSSSSTACANAYVRTTTTTTAADSRLFWSSGQDCNDDVVADNTRRRILTSSINPRSPISAAIIVVGFSTSMPCSFAANAAASTVTSSQEQKDKENLIRGYNRLQYLLDNWEKETTICKIGQETTFGDKCERTPTKVMEYLGFKSTNDPLFKADATMMRLKDAIPPKNSNREAEYYDAIDSFVQNSEEANSMAFVSSWGEANPGGGKDRVRLFIERSKKNVMASRDGLETVMDILDLKP